jgi:hypothetical protein
MARHKRKTGMEDATAIVMGFANLVDALFLRYSGKTMQTVLKEFGERPRQLLGGETAAPSESAMPLVDAYAILGLKPNAPLEDVKKHYWNLANLFHPDKGGYAEAMRLLNQAYERVKKEKKTK